MIRSTNRNWRVGVVIAGALAAVLSAGLRGAAGQAGSATQERPARREFSQAEREYWAYQPVVRPEVPQVGVGGTGVSPVSEARAAWVRNPIDAFVLARLEAEGIAPAPEAARVTLIRRATFDLHGLPPTPEEVEAFVNDPAPGAFERLIDRLLESPRYGERWARHWLDLARYAESNGFKSDEDRPNVWRYRDWVINAFNSDLPYNEFVRLQIAGDELDGANPDALVATGFLLHWADESNARNLPLRRQEILNDVTDTVGSVFLGLTVGCAQCHDHKYDAILQDDYYRLQAFFAGMQPWGDVLLASDEEVAEHDYRMAEWEAATREIRAEMAAMEAPHRQRLERENLQVFPEEVQQAYLTAPEERTPLERQLAANVARQVAVTIEQLSGAMSEEERARWEALRERLASYDALRPPELATARAVRDIGPVAPPAFVLAGGSYNQPLYEVEPGFLSILGSEPPALATGETPVPPEGGTTGRRRVLADWLASRENPLTARVMVNRIWQHHFGVGIVATASDFGVQGEPPTHPELLDWLAAEFIDSGWSMKHMHRLMMTSSAYRMGSYRGQGSGVGGQEGGTAGLSSSVVGEDEAAARWALAEERDPEDRLLWRQRAQRLEAEAIRDAMLSVSGLLNLEMGGPSVRPELPAGLSGRYGWEVSEDARERSRRSIYVFVKRNLPYPLFAAFDQPDTHESCSRRAATTTAPQALMMSNGELVLGYARAFAGRVLREAGNDPAAQIERAYRLAFSRAPTEEELAAARAFLDEQRGMIAARMAAGEAVLAPEPMPQGQDAAAGAALVDFCHAVLNANEFIYVD